MKFLFNQDMSIEEINTLVEGWSDEKFEEVFDIPYNKLYIRKLNKKKKERMSAHADRKIDRALDKIIEIMKKGKYENLRLE